MNQHFVDSENVRCDVANNNSVESLKNGRIGHLAVLTREANPTRGNVYISNDRSDISNGDDLVLGKESQPKGRYSNIEEGLESSVSNEAKERINRIVGEVKSLSDVEKLLLYLRLPTGDTSKDLRQTPTSCLQTSNRTEQAQAYTWIRSHLEEDIEICLPKQEVYDDYRLYCENHGIRPLSTADFGKLMKCVFPNVKPRRLGQRGQSRYCYGGLRKKLDIEAPGLPELEISPHKQQDTGSEDDELYSASCQLVCEWAQKLLDQSFPSVRELAEHLVSQLYVNSKSVSAFTVVASMQDTGIQNTKVPSMFSNTTGGDRHRETQLQLQRKLHEREQLREHKKKIQQQKEENEQKAKEAQDRMTPSLTSPTLLRALTSPARRIFERKDYEVKFQDGDDSRSKSVVNTSSKPKQSTERSKSTTEMEKSGKKHAVCQDMEVDMSRSPGKGQGQPDYQQGIEEMDISHSNPEVRRVSAESSDPKEIQSSVCKDLQKVFSKLRSEVNEDFNKDTERNQRSTLTLRERLNTSSSTIGKDWNLERESDTGAFHTIRKPSVLSQNRSVPGDQGLTLASTVNTGSKVIEISSSPECVNSQPSEQDIPNEHKIDLNKCDLDITEDLGKSDETPYLSSSSSSSSSPSVSSRSAFVPFSQMGTRKETDMLSIRIPSVTATQLNTTAVSSKSIQSSSVTHFPSISSSESHCIVSLGNSVKPPGTLSLNLNSPGTLTVPSHSGTTVGMLGAISTSSDVPVSQTLPQTSPSTPKKTKTRFTPIRPKASPSKTVSTILKEQKTSTENSMYDKSKPVATLLKEKRAREAEVLAQMKGGVTNPNSCVQIQNVQNITASTLTKSLELNKPGEFFIILNPAIAATPVSKMSVVSPVSTVTQASQSSTATMATSIRSKLESVKGQKSTNPSRSRTNSSSESEIESIFPSGKECSALALDSAEESFTEVNLDETPSKLVKIDSDQGVSSRPGSRCSVDRETPSFGRKRKFYNCGSNSYHKRINSTDDTDDEVLIIDSKENNKDTRRAKSCNLEHQEKEGIVLVPEDTLNNTADSLHCPDISILEIDALSDSGLESEHLQLLSDTNASRPATQTQAVGVNCLSFQRSQRELLKQQKEVLDERMKSYWNKEGKIGTKSQRKLVDSSSYSTIRQSKGMMPRVEHREYSICEENISRKSDIVNMEVHGELPQDVADFITDALTGIANTNINENEDTLKGAHTEMETQGYTVGTNVVDQGQNSAVGVCMATGQNFLQPTATSPMPSVRIPKKKELDKNQGLEVASTLNKNSATDFVSPQRPVRRQRTPSVERLLGPTVTSERHMQLHSPLDRGLTTQYIPEQSSKVPTPTSFVSPVHPVMQRKRELSVDRISNQTPFSDAGYGSIGASPILTSTPVSSIGGVCDTTLNSTASAGLFISRPDSVQSLASDTVMQSPVPPFSPRNYTSTPLTLRSPCPPLNSNPVQSPVSTGAPTRAFMPIQSSSTQKLETTVTLIKPTVTIASGSVSEDLIGIGTIQPEDVRQTRPPPSYKVAVQSQRRTLDGVDNPGAFNPPMNSPMDIPMTETGAKSHSMMGVREKGNSISSGISEQDSSKQNPDLASSYPCSFQLALMSKKSREDLIESSACRTIHKSGNRSVASLSQSPGILGQPSSEQSAGLRTGQLDTKSGQAMSKPFPLIYRHSNSQLSDQQDSLFSQDGQTKECRSASDERDTKERDIECILNLLKEPNEHTGDEKRRISSKKVPAVLPNANYRGDTPNVNLANSHAIGRSHHYVIDKVMSSVIDDVEFSARRNLMPDLMEEPSTEINEEELRSTLEDLRSVDEKYFVQDNFDFNSKRI